jgi:hypothetical protein
MRSRMMRRERNTVLMGKMRKVQAIAAGEPEGKTPSRRLRCRLDRPIKIILSKKRGLI